MAEKVAEFKTRPETVEEWARMFAELCYVRPGDDGEPEAIGFRTSPRKGSFMVSLASLDDAVKALTMVAQGLKTEAGKGLMKHKVSQWKKK